LSLATSSSKLVRCVPREVIITLSEFVLGVLGILVLLLSYLVELAYHVLCNAGFPLWMVKHVLEAEDWCVAVLGLIIALACVLCFKACSGNEARVYWRPSRGGADDDKDKREPKKGRKGSGKGHTARPRVG
jgi:hypothetical protein